MPKETAYQTAIDRAVASLRDVDLTARCPALGLPEPVGPAIVAGNRNAALFLMALPASVTEPLLILLGCYQLPMYLTPILLARLYGRPSPKGDPT